MGSIEGKRGMPRLRPPFPAVRGLWDSPSNINNVETYANVPAHHPHGRRAVREDRHREEQGHEGLRPGGKDQARRHDRGAHGHQPARGHLRHRRRHPGRQEVQGGADGRPLGRAACRKASPTCWSTTTPSPRRAPSWAPAAWWSWTSPPAWWTWPATSSPSSRASPAASAPSAASARSGCWRSSPASPRARARRKDIAELEELAAKVKISSLCGLGQTAPNPVLTTLQLLPRPSTTTTSATSAARRRSARRSSATAWSPRHAPAACCARGSAPRRRRTASARRSHDDRPGTPASAAGCASRRAGSTQLRSRRAPASAHEKAPRTDHGRGED